jgi:hypothetical protein
VDSKVNVALDPHTKAPHTDQLSLSLDREVSTRLTVSLAYVRKDGKHFISWTDTAGVYESQMTTLPDGRAFPVLALTNSTADRRFLLTNPDGYFLRYNGMIFVVQRRMAGRWSALSSYTFSKAEGLQPFSATTPGGPQFSSTFGGGAFGRDPNSLTNASGKLANDRTHMFRSMGSIEVPRTGLIIAGNFQYLTGQPWASTALINLPQGIQRVLLEPRGSRRLSSQTLLDLRLSKPLRIGEKARVELLLDVLNVLNNKAEEGLADDNLFSQNFGRPSVFIDPRRAMLGVRFALGR